ncbi:TolC family protein [Legionella hackeliae]|uniref:Multidrug efflux protein, outer membrane component n=1 Tax=Legionella hackeliae TaxID=449 RepID=A0A0A8URK8_LEGHA|nr:TolC family protein [Legionella hackeliae]KTD13187.1 multidrug efflux protein, outer membrane component [Legionella hackeliae]CEK11500.1 Multidrug efflux protein, outer membrane component [Legionella hackeliae]STX48268.1 multidrug efflux protein, outer membrane component [Legionella hackeliae]
MMLSTFIEKKWLFFLITLITFNAFAKEAPLTLKDILHSVDCFYPQIRIAQLEINKAQGDFLSAVGQFDPSLDINTRSQPFGGYINNYGDGQFNIPTLYNGIKVFGGYRLGRGDWPIYYQNYLTNSGGEYRAGISLPLLKDRKIDRERTELLSKAQQIQVKQQEVQSTKIRIYKEAIVAYWQWVETGLQLRNFEALLKLAKVRQNAIRKQAERGDLPSLSVSENLQLIVQRAQLLNQSKMAFEQAAINLSLYYRNTDGKPKIASPSAIPRFLSRLPAKMSVSIGELQSHPALKKLDNYKEVIKLKKNLAQNDLLPNLDATAYTFKQEGSGGYPRLIPQAGMVGLSFKFPLLQREAKGRIITASSELQQIQTERRFLHEQLKIELHNLFVGIKIYERQIELLKKELKLAQRVQSGEETKFYEGDSTLFLVNQREQATTQVKLNLINAKIKLYELNDLAYFFSSTQFKSFRPKKKSLLTRVNLKQQSYR